jgi:hypothetical protein
MVRHNVKTLQSTRRAEEDVDDSMRSSAEFVVDHNEVEEIEDKENSTLEF